MLRMTSVLASEAVEVVGVSIPEHCASSFYFEIFLFDSRPLFVIFSPFGFCGSALDKPPPHHAQLQSSFSVYAK
jgi:hypothetical protein